MILMYSMPGCKYRTGRLWCWTFLVHYVYVLLVRCRQIGARANRRPSALGNG